MPDHGTGVWRQRELRQIADEHLGDQPSRALPATAADVTIIGSPSNGAITSTILPGNLVVSLAGPEVRFADGRQLQRVGVHLAHGKQPPFFSFQGIAPDSRHVIEYLWHDGGCDVEL